MSKRMKGRCVLKSAVSGALLLLAVSCAADNRGVYTSARPLLSCAVEGTVARDDGPDQSGTSADRGRRLSCYVEIGGLGRRARLGPLVEGLRRDVGTVRPCNRTPIQE